jgi:hypothetical protein
MTPQEEILALRADLAARIETETRLKRAIITLDASGLSPEAVSMVAGLRLALQENYKLMASACEEISRIKADNCWGSSTPGYYL